MASSSSSSSSSSSWAASARPGTGSSDCYICCSSMAYEAILPCRHSRQLCGTCVMRLCQDHQNKETLHKQKNRHEKTKTPFPPIACPFCRQEWKYVILSKRGESGTLAWDSFSTSGMFNIGKMSKAFATTSNVAEFFERMVSLHCVECWESAKKDSRFRSLSLLQDHLRSAHKKNLCLTCAEYRGAFVADLKMYSDRELHVHRRQGGPSMAPHPTCGFCRKQFYGQDELFVHLERAHENCPICRDDNGNAHRYFERYKQLEEHFRSSHFLCDDQGCRAARFVVFASDIDLRAHRLRTHRDKLTQKERREMSTVQVDLVYRPVHDVQRDRSRHRGRQTSPPPPARSPPPPEASASSTLPDHRDPSPSPAVPSPGPFVGRVWSEQRQQVWGRPPAVEAFPSLREAHGRGGVQAGLERHDGPPRPTIVASHVSPYQQKVLQQTQWAPTAGRKAPRKNKKQREKQRQKELEEQQQRLKEEELKQRLEEEEQKQRLKEEEQKQRLEQEEEKQQQEQVDRPRNETAASVREGIVAVKQDECVDDGPAPASKKGLPFPDLCPTEQIRPRKLLFEQKLRLLLLQDKARLNEFRRLKDQYLSGSVVASDFLRAFLAAVGGLNAGSENLLMEMIALMQDQKKRRALHVVYRASFERTASPEPSPEQDTAPSGRCDDAPVPRHADTAAAASAATAVAVPTPLDEPVSVHPTWQRGNSRRPDTAVVGVAKPQQKPQERKPQQQQQQQQKQQQKQTWRRPLPPEAFPTLRGSVENSKGVGHLETDHDDTNNRTWASLIEHVELLQPTSLSIPSVACRRLNFLVKLARDCLGALEERIPPDEPIQVSNQRLEKPRSAARRLSITDLDVGIPLRNLGIEVKAVEMLRTHSHDDYDVVRDWIRSAIELMSVQSLYVLVDYVLTVYNHLVADAPSMASQAESTTANSHRSRPSTKKKTKKQVLMHFG